ncbi:MAG: sigma 54-interacting transcriptional regulator [bacterium]
MASATILVVEDEFLIAKNIQNRLKRFGYDVPTIASSGEEALRKTEQMRRRPDLVLIDIKLKGDMDGVEAAKQIRDRFNIPVVYITAYADKKTLERAKTTEPLGYLLKPFGARELHSAVEIALNKHKLEKKIIKREQWLTTTLKSIGDAVIATDINGLITFMNPVAETLTGWKQKDAFGRKLTEVFNIMNEETREPVEDPATKAIQERMVIELQNHTLLIAKDGTERQIEDSAAPIIDDKGEISGAVLVFRVNIKPKQEKEGQTQVGEKGEVAQKYKIITLYEKEPVSSERRPPGFDDIISQSKTMYDIFNTINHIAKTESNILIYGETGTGKELVAHTIHSHSLRKDSHFIPVDCVALPETLLESELFGYEKGAFTGAQAMRRGLLEYADRGTLFLDEICELSRNLQSKLLRVLQEREFRRIGGKKLIKVDLRILSATNKNPVEAVKSGLLREDLFYRLNVIPLEVPPLRARKEDIPLLVNYYFDKFTRTHQLKEKVIEPEAMEALVNYFWPGNVRELQNVIERLTCLVEDSHIELLDLPDHIVGSKDLEKIRLDPVLDLAFFEAKEKIIQQFEKEYISKLLKKYPGNISKAAKQAQISRRTLYRLINYYHLHGLA